MLNVSRFLVLLYFTASAILMSDAGAAWDTTVIDNYVESVRKCWERPAVTIGIVELDDNDDIKQAYANSYGRVDPTCEASNCTRVGLSNC